MTKSCMAGSQKMHFSVESPLLSGERPKIIGQIRHTFCQLFKWKISGIEEILHTFAHVSRKSLLGSFSISKSDTSSSQMRVISSVGLERCLDRAEVTGSNPVLPTITFLASGCSAAW